MTDEQQKRLAAIHNRATRYEVTVTRQNGDTARVCYAVRKSGRGLRSVLHSYSAPVIAFIGGTDACTACMNGPTIALVDADRTAVVKFSGRTERDAILAEELPWCGALAPSP